MKHPSHCRAERLRERAALSRGQSAFEYLLLITGGVLFVILTVAVVRTALITNQNAVNNTAGGYQTFAQQRGDSALYQADVNTSCVAGWSFEEGSGTSTYNAKGNSADNGTLMESPTWTTGKKGSGILFDGTNDYVNISKSSTFNLTTYTISAWVKTSSTADYQYPFDNAGPSANLGGYSIEINAIDAANGGLPSCVTVNATATQYQQAFGTFNFSTHLNEWHHVACTFDGTITRIYTDGAPDGSDSTPAITMITPPYTAVIGKVANNAQYYFNGAIDEVAVYNRALTPDEVAALYRSQTTWCS